TVDRMIGIPFGFIRGIFVIAFLFLLLNVSQSDKNIPAVEHSFLAPRFMPIVAWLQEVLPKDILPQKQNVQIAKQLKLQDLNKSVEQNEVK
ncbi:MAG: hypothetical protein AAGG80_07670, partial [Pseudomonadota bacterium]